MFHSALPIKHLLFLVLVNQFLPAQCRRIKLRSEFPLDDQANFETLKFVQVIHRHGDRNSVVATYPTDPYKDIQIGPKGFGQLTAIGKLQGYHLGQYLRSRYSGFLNHTYSSNEMKAYSGDQDRLIQTCASVLAALYPPSREDPESQWNPAVIPNWQPIPVHTISNSIDNKLHPRNCPTFNELLQTIGQNCSTCADFDEKHKMFLDFIAKQSGIQIGTDLEAKVFAMLTVYDNMNVEQHHGYPLPDWTTEYPNFWKTFKEIAQHEMYQQVSTYETKLLKGGPFFTLLMNNMKEATNFQLQNPIQPPPKMLIFSGHDTTITPILSIIGFLTDEFELPNYASALILELHKEPSTSDYFGKIFFYNHPEEHAQELLVPECGQPCSLEQLTTLKSAYLINDADWANKCGLNSSALIV